METQRTIEVPNWVEIQMLLDRNAVLRLVGRISMGQFFSQVRQQRGSGTRHLTLDKDVTMAEIKDIATKLFFPNGKSKLGKVKEFEITLMDHQDDALDPSTTLLEHIERVKLKMLRVYIFTKHLEEPDEAPKSSSKQYYTHISCSNEHTWDTSDERSIRWTSQELVDLLVFLIIFLIQNFCLQMMKSCSEVRCSAAHWRYVSWHFTFWKCQWNIASPEYLNASK